MVINSNKGKIIVEVVIIATVEDPCAVFKTAAIAKGIIILKTFIEVKLSR